MSGTVHPLQPLLHDEIPLTRALGLEVVSYQAGTLTLKAPLAPNANHKGTAFGGSLYCMALVAGWGWLHLALREAGIDDGQVVIHEAQVKYQAPVEGELVAVCAPPPVEAWERFVAMYQRRGRARISLDARVLGEGGDALRFSGQFVLQR